MSTLERVERLTLDDFVRLYEKDGPFEVIGGERFPVTPTIARHNQVIKRLFLALHVYVEGQALGEVFSEMPFVLTYEANWVAGARVPDVMVYTAARLAAYRAEVPDWAEKPYVLVPDLVAEVVSPNDRYSDLNRKVDAYLTDGVGLIWMIDPQRQVATVYQQDRFVTVGVGEMVSGGDILPGLTITVDSLFT